MLPVLHVQVLVTDGGGRSVQTELLPHGIVRQALKSAEEDDELVVC